MRPRIIGRRVVHYGAVGSTMDEAAALAAAREPEGTVVVADAQTAGRGRAGRPWQTPAGAALLCSVLLRPRVEATRLSVLPLLAGVAVAEVIEETAGVVCRLKWPNDVWIDGRKVAGILVNTRVSSGNTLSVVVGIGINVNTSPVELPDGATSLALATGVEYDRSIVLTALLERLDAAYRAFIESDDPTELEGWHSRAALIGESVAVIVGTRRLTGVMRGVDNDGALLLECEPGDLRRIVAGDLVRGPVRTTNANALGMLGM